MALKTKIEIRNLVLNTVDERRLEHQLQRLERRLGTRPEPQVTVTVTSHPALRLIQADLNVRLGPAGAQLISHQTAETADHAVALAVDAVLRQQERHHARLIHESSFGVPSRREAREHRRQPAPAPQANGAASSAAPTGSETGGDVDRREMSIVIDPPAPPAGASLLSLAGTLEVPNGAHGLVIFAHGSGSSRYSPRNRRVARILQGGGFGTLLLDLLTAAEGAEDALTGHLRFDIDLLAGRLVGAAMWLRMQPETRDLPLGYFGASTGAGAALVAAAAHPELVDAIVSRGGRPDLASAALELVQAPTLLIVGADDQPVVEMNREALARLHAPKQLAIIPGATHLFEEPGALDQVAELAREWFTRYLTPDRAAVARPYLDAATMPVLC